MRCRTRAGFKTEGGVRLQPDFPGFETTSSLGPYRTGSKDPALHQHKSAVRLSSPATRRSRLRTHATLTASLLLLFLAVWIVVPAPSAVWLPLAVAAPELSPWILVIAIVLVLSALPIITNEARTRRPAQAALALAALAAALAVWPIVSAARTAPRLAAAMRDALAEDALRAVSSDPIRRMRARPIVVADLFRGIHTDDRRPSAVVMFASPEGVPLRMNVHAPPTAGPHPAIVQIYGGAWQRGSPDNDAIFAQYFAARGYVVFAVDYRHAPRWRWPAQLDDVRSALQWVREHGGDHGADVSRIALVGRSAGAHLALLAAYWPDTIPVKAVVSLYGPTDLVRGYREPPRPDPMNVRALLTAFIGGTPDDLPAAYRDASPLTYATRPLPPTLLVYGGRDHVVSPGFGASLHERLRATGTTSVLLTLPWAEHAFDAVPFGLGSQLALFYQERFLAWALKE